MSQSVPPPSNEPIDPKRLEGPDEGRAASAAPTESERLESAAEHDPYVAWRARDFRFYAVGATGMSLGMLMVYTAINWQIYHLTGLERSIGWLGLVQALPVILLSLPAGHVADRYSRKAVMLLTGALIAVVSLSLALVSGRHLSTLQSEALLLTLAAAEAGAGTFFRPARNAMLPSLLKAEHFSNAVTWNSTLFELASVVGPAVAGGLIDLDIRWTYTAAAILQVGMLPALWMIRPPPTRRTGEPAGFASLIAGVHFVRRTRKLLGAITLDLFAVLFGGVTFLLPAFAEKQLHVGAIGFGFLRAAPSVGAVTMSLLQSHSRPLRNAGRTMMLAVTGFGAATIVFAFSRNYWLSLAMLMFTGACDNISVVVRHTLVQLITPDSMRGRVSAVNQIFIGSSNELGGMESGLTAAAFGIVVSAAGGGILSIVTVIAIALLFPELRRLGKLSDVKPAALVADLK